MDHPPVVDEGEAVRELAAEEPPRVERFVWVRESVEVNRPDKSFMCLLTEEPHPITQPRCPPQPNWVRSLDLMIDGIAFLNGKGFIPRTPRVGPPKLSGFGDEECWSPRRR